MVLVTMCNLPHYSNSNTASSIFKTFARKIRTTVEQFFSFWWAGCSWVSTRVEGHSVPNHFSERILKYLSNLYVQNSQIHRNAVGGTLTTNSRAKHYWIPLGQSLLQCHRNYNLIPQALSFTTPFWWYHHLTLLWNPTSLPAHCNTFMKLD